MEKKYLELLFKVIKDYKTPKMTLGRLRDGLLRDLSVPTDQFIKDRNEIYLKFCDKNEDGSPNIIEDKYKFAPTLLEEINGELKILGDEKVDIKFPPETKNMVEESSYESLPGETLIIDNIIKLL